MEAKKQIRLVASHGACHQTQERNDDVAKEQNN